MNGQRKTIGRRQFLGQSAAAATAFSIVQAKSVAGTTANSKIEIGIIGFGARGAWISEHFHTHGGYQIVALADVFADKLKEGQEKEKVDPKRCYLGLNAYKELLASKVDAVMIESPPYCHPEQAMAAVEAGKHVFLAKPVATDVPGCRTIMAAGEKAKGKVSFLVDFQTRAMPLFNEAAKRVHDGQLGQPVCGQVYYDCGILRTRIDPKNPAKETRLRNWLFDIGLSGDIIVEQNVHVMDVANWFLKTHPVKAYGSGGQKARVGYGDAWDHFVVIYWYPDDVLIDFSSTQFIKSEGTILTRVYGSKGTVDANYQGLVTITGEQPWPGGESKDTYAQGVRNNVKAFAESIHSGKYLNNAETSAISTLSCVLGRMAAYKGCMVTWDEMMKANEKLESRVEECL